MTTVLVADDQALMRAGLRRLIESEPALDVVAEASDGAEAVQGCREHHPDVALLDIRMPRLDGIQATRQIVAASSRPHGSCSSRCSTSTSTSTTGCARVRPGSC